MLNRCGFLIMKYTNEKNEEFVLMQLRDDGKLGFIGGGINEDEDIRDGIVREVFEETSFQNIDTARMIKLKSFTFNDCEIHSYTYNITKDELEQILSGQINGAHFLFESYGFISVPLTMYLKQGNISEFFKNNFAGTAREEFKLLI